MISKFTKFGVSLVLFSLFLGGCSMEHSWFSQTKPGDLSAPPGEDPEEFSHFSKGHQQELIDVYNNTSLMEEALAKELPPLEVHWDKMKRLRDSLVTAIKNRWPNNKWDYGKDIVEHRLDSAATFNKDFPITYRDARRVYDVTGKMNIENFKAQDYVNLRKIVDDILVPAGFTIDSGMFTKKIPNKINPDFDWYYVSKPAIPGENRWDTVDKITVGGVRYLVIAVETGYYLSKASWDKYYQAAASSVNPIKP